MAAAPPKRSRRLLNRDCLPSNGTSPPATRPAANRRKGLPGRCCTEPDPAPSSSPTPMAAAGTAPRPCPCTFQSFRPKATNSPRSPSYWPQALQSLPTNAIMRGPETPDITNLVVVSARKRTSAPPPKGKSLPKKQIVAKHFSPWQQERD